MSPTYGVEEIPSQLYDSKTLGATDVSSSLFQDQVGVGGKTFYDTNMTASGQLPLPQTFKCYGFRAAALPDTTIALTIALMKGTMRLFVGHKHYYTIPLFWLSAGGGLFLNHEEAGAGTFGYGCFGEPRGDNIHLLSTPIEIGQGESLRVDLAWPVAPNVTKIYIFLVGLLTRATQ